MISFTEQHKNVVGYVTNQPGEYDSARPHASAVVCDREECKTKAKRFVAYLTNETAVFVPYGT